MLKEADGFVKIEFIKDDQPYVLLRSNHDKDEEIAKLERDGAEILKVTEEVFL